MKGYGLKLKDAPRDCTARGKFGNVKMFGVCACGKKHSVRSAKKGKSAKAWERKKRIELD